MYKIREMNSEKSKINAHVANQFRLTDHSYQEKGQGKIWPEAFNPYASDQKSFPESRSRFPANR